MPRRKVYLYAAILTIILYLLGVYTGVYFSQKALAGQETFQELKAEIQLLKNNLENIQLQQLYVSASETTLGCNFLVSDINKIQNDLGYFIQRLPQKLEVYESSGQVDEEYEEVKREYMLVSLRVWLLSTIAKDRCKENIVPILYFYSKNCTKCIEQGSVLDSIRDDVENIAIFTIDLNLDETIVETIKESYVIKETPALIINNYLYEGFINSTELKEILV
ncbi:MAG: hypothetical protein ISS36_01095 [Candidatus Aenigmarchaeota archaeon]|nr:hypothetical protein [Candidatus Aenigmarchaeota archaeon]